MHLTSDARRYLPAENADTSILYQKRWFGSVAYMLEVEGDFRNAAIYKERFVAIEDSIKRMNISQGVDMLHAKQAVEADSHEKDSRLKSGVVWIVILVVAVLIAGVFVVYFQRRNINDRHKNQKQEKALAEALKQLETLNAKLEEEKNRLKEYREHSHDDRKFLNAYIEKFNKILIACQLKEGYYQDVATEIVNKIIESKESFLQHAGQLYVTKYPYNVDILRSSKLTEQELNICYLIDLGMQSRHIAKFLGIGNIYNKTKEIREKLGLVNSRSNLKTCLSKELTFIPTPDRSDNCPDTSVLSEH